MLRLPDLLCVNILIFRVFIQIRPLVQVSMFFQKPDSTSGNHGHASQAVFRDLVAYYGDIVLNLE